MPAVTAFDLRADPPPGWDGEIYKRPPLRVPATGRGAAAGGAAGGSPGAATLVTELTMPVVHLANFALPRRRGDYGGAAVETMRPDDIFIALLEHPASEAGSALFRLDRPPWPLSPADFDPATMQRAVPGGAGHQSFFRSGARAFCCYVVIGSFARRAELVPVVNTALGGVSWT